MSEEIKKEEQAAQLNPEELEKVSGGLEGNLEVPEGYKRVCAHCGSDRVWYWSGFGAPACHDCWQAQYIFVKI